MSKPISPPAVTQQLGQDLPAYVSNGIIGMRVLDVPFRPGVVLVNGLAAPHPLVGIDAAARAPYPVAGDLGIDGLWLRTSPERSEFVEQRYDFGTGELLTRFAFHGEHATARATVVTSCSRSQPTIVLQETEVTVDAACTLTLRAMVDHGPVQGSMVARRVRDAASAEPDADGSMAWRPAGGTATCGIAFVTRLMDGPAVPPSYDDAGDQHPLMTSYRFDARPGQTYRMEQMASLVPDVLNHRPELAAVRLVMRAQERSFTGVRDDDRRIWEDLWRGRVVITADDDRWQALADAAFFYLNTSVHASAPCSTSIFGLAQWQDYHYYYGHVMWDVDLFCVPPLLLLQPDAARSLLEFRSQTIPAARSNAKLVGRHGLQFPWESGPGRGEESSPRLGKGSWHSDHVSPDIAWAFSQFAHASGDQRFLEDRAAPVLYGVADWIASRVERAGDRYTLRDSMGVAERTRPADDDAFTVMAMNTVLREAISCARRLGDPVAAPWLDVVAGLTPEPSPGTGAILSHEGYHPREEKGATPGPLAGIFPLWYPMDDAVRQRTLAYYLALADDYAGSPMLSPLYPVWACWSGDRQLAARLLETGYADLIGGRFLQTLEYVPSKFPDEPRAGPFFANMGGFLMGLLYGLPGIQVSSAPSDEWPSRPVVLPEGWRSIEVERALVQGGSASIEATDGADRARISVRRDARKGRGAAGDGGGSSTATG